MPGSFSIMPWCSFFGAVKIWWHASHLLSSSFHSNIGKSRIQQNLKDFLSIRPSFSPSSILNLLNTWFTIFFLSAMKNKTEPGFAFVFSINSFFISSLKNFAMLLSKPFSVTRIHAMPFAPFCMQSWIKESISFLPNLSGGLMHLINSAPLKT